MHLLWGQLHVVHEQSYTTKERNIKDKCHFTFSRLFQPVFLIVASFLQGNCIKIIKLGFTLGRYIRSWWIQHLIKVCKSIISTAQFLLHGTGATQNFIWLTPSSDLGSKSTSLETTRSSFPSPTPTSTPLAQHAYFFHDTMSFYLLVNFFVICSQLFHPPRQKVNFTRPCLVTIVIPGTM